MKPWCRTALVCVFLCSPLGPAAWAQTGLPSMPLGMDLKKAKVGTYGDYELTIGPAPTMKMRLALVGRHGENNIIETILEGGMIDEIGGKITARLLLDPALTPIKMVTQAGDGDPEEMPASQTGTPGDQKMQRPDPKELVGRETVKVKGARIKAQHYRSKTSAGTKDTWFSDEVPPFGLVKMTTHIVTPSGHPQEMKVELVGRGNDAKITITKTPRALDPKVAAEPAAALK